MGFLTFMKKVFIGEEEDDAELRAARARHNIVIEDDKKRGAREADEEKPPFDPWEEVDNLRRNFFLGSWASRKFRPIGEDKLKEKLNELEKKRQEEEKRKKEEQGE